MSIQQQPKSCWQGGIKSTRDIKYSSSIFKKLISLQGAFPSYLLVYLWEICFIQEAFNVQISQGVLRGREFDESFGGVRLKWFQRINKVFNLLTQVVPDQSDRVSIISNLEISRKIQRTTNEFVNFGLDSINICWKIQRNTSNKWKTILGWTVWIFVGKFRSQEN